MFLAGPYDKDFNILGSILGSPMHGNYHVLLCSLCGITVSTVTAMLTITTAGHLQVVL